jgi:hypothetical protein
VPEECEGPAGGRSWHLGAKEQRRFRTEHHYSNIGTLSQLINGKPFVFRKLAAPQGAQEDAVA